MALYSVQTYRVSCDIVDLVIPQMLPYGVTLPYYTVPGLKRLIPYSYQVSNVGAFRVLQQVSNGVTFRTAFKNCVSHFLFLISNGAMISYRVSNRPVDLTAKIACASANYLKKHVFELLTGNFQSPYVVKCGSQRSSPSGKTQRFPTAG